MSRLLDGRTVAITGAAQGLGRAYAEAAAAAGARLILNDVEDAPLHESARSAAELGAEVEIVVGSVAEWDTGARLVDRAESRFGGLDGLVNNAAISPSADARTLDRAMLDAVVDVNIRGALACGAHALRAMVAHGRGAIVNVVSGAVFGIPELSLYGASKGALLAATYGWAVDAEGTGVRVNAVSPIARTPLTDTVRGAGDQTAIALPAAIAPAVIYLLSDLSGALTGQVLRFDGRSLGIQTPPTFAAVAEPRAGWSPQDIGAFIDTHRGALPGYGLARAVPAEIRTPGASERTTR